jgi:hypothetical protein
VSRAGAVRKLRAVKEQPAGMIGVIAQDTARFSMFGASVSSIQAPFGSHCQWVLGNDITDNCNRLIRHGQESGVNFPGEWLWLLGDDHAFPPFTLNNLLAHDVDIVVPLCLTRLPPFEPVMFSGWYDEENGVRKRVWLDDYPDGGLIDIHSAGSAGMLIRRHVLEAMEEPWFQKYPKNGSYLAEDLYFCDRARELGFSICADLDTKFGHISSTIVWPQQTDGGWSPGLGFPDGFMITLPHGSWIQAEDE